MPSRKQKGPQKGKRPTMPKHADEREKREHQTRFNQLLDDAIFGVKKKNQRG
jgi:hypothetical protein